MNKTYEQVSKYHPDKYADAIAQALVDNFTKSDPNAHCGIEVMVKDNKVVLGGEVTYTPGRLEWRTFDGICKDIVQDVARSLGYKVNRRDITNLISEQSPEINKAVGDYEGAGDQGIVVGYATDEDEYGNIDIGMHYANELIRLIEEDIAKGKSIFTGDAKVQVTMHDIEIIETLVISTCVSPHIIDRSVVNMYVIKNIIGKFKKKYPYAITRDDTTRLLINPSGLWTIGGPVADAGITGRKLVCDFYGPDVPIGGGNIWGKDNTKVDRSGAMAARIIALDIIRAFKSEVVKVRVEIAYAIGVSEPVTVRVLPNYSNHNNEILEEWVKENYDLTPKGLRDLLAKHKGKTLNYRW